MKRSSHHRQNISNHRGFTLVEIMLVVAIIALIAAISLPSFIKARNTSQQNACINNLKQVSNAKDQASIAYYLGEGSEIAAATVHSYLRNSATPECPGGGTYTYNAIGTNPECDISEPRSHALSSSPSVAGNVP